MDEFESVFAQDPEEEIQRKIANIEEQLSTVSPLGVSSQVIRTLKQLTRKTYVGTGADGDATFGGGAVTGFTLSGTTYTMIGDRNLNNVVVQDGYVIVGRQYLLFIKGNLTNKGTIYANGAWW